MGKAGPAARIPPVLLGSAAAAQTVDPSAGMRWREIGPYRAGRGRAVAGVPSQPNVFYISFDNGGVWRSTDFGSNWVPLFDDQSTGSIGAIAVAPSDPNIIYVGSGAGIIRPDLATGDGMYKSTDAGKTWTHLGLRDSQMIGYVDVDPTNPNRLFVAVLGHPYGPNQERGIFRSTDGGQTFAKVLYKDEYTSANEVRIDPANPKIVYATLWQQQQSFIEGQGRGQRHLQVHRRRHDVEATHEWSFRRHSGEHRYSAEQSAGDLHVRGDRDADEQRYRRRESLQDQRRRRPLGSRRDRLESPGPTPARPHRRRRSSDNHRRSEE